MDMVTMRRILGGGESVIGIHFERAAPCISKQYRECLWLQVAPFEQLESLPHLSSQDLSSRQRLSTSDGAQPAVEDDASQSATQRLMAAASRR